MTRSVALALLLAVGSARGVDPSADLVRDFAHRQALPRGLVPGQLYRIRLPDDVFNGCAAYPADLRIVDSAGRNWPFFPWAPRSRESLRALRTEVLNRSVAAQEPRYIRQDLRVLPDGPDAPPARHDRVAVLTGGSDFLRRVEVLGSEEGRNWVELGQGYLVDHARGLHVSNRVITYPVSTLPLLQVRIYPDAANARAPVELVGMELSCAVGETGEVAQVELKPLPVPASERKEGIQVLLYDTGAANRLLDSLRLEAEDAAFARPVRVFGRNSATNGWRWVADGGVHKLGGQTRDRVALSGASYRQMKVELFHYDDPPLRIARATADYTPVYLVAEALAADPVWLYYGSSRLQLPRFDLQRRTPDPACRAAPVLNLEPRQANPLNVAAGLVNYGRWLAAMIVGLVSLLVLVVIMNMIKRQRGD